jgi:SAM-dependent methyltransferase/uncharacterized protein YbaR (Trm112 family)
VKDAALLERLLVCPESREGLKFAGKDRMVTSGGREYRVMDGVPILRAGPVKRVDSEHESNPLSEEFQRFMSSAPGPVLFLGAGSTRFRADNVIELEYNLFRNTDVVGDAHRLPFAAGSLAAVVALNVFEHLSDPPAAAAEIHRVLEPGGEVLIHTAFLQPLHEEPAHFYNVTEFGLRRWFEPFATLDVTVSPNFNPYFALAWISSLLLSHVEHHLGKREQRLLSGVTLGQLAKVWEDRRHPSEAVYEVFQRLPEEVQRRMAAGFQLKGKKQA